MSDTIWAAVIALFGTGGFAGLLYRLHRNATHVFQKELAAERETHLRAIDSVGQRLDRFLEAFLKFLQRGK